MLHQLVLQRNLDFEEVAHNMPYIHNAFVKQVMPKPSDVTKGSSNGS